MFRKMSSTTVCYPEQNDLKYTFDFESVMQFVKNNKIIPVKLEKIKESAEAKGNMAKLASFINDADETIFNDPVFSHPDCQIYTLSLLQDKKISITDFLDLNIYLTTLMQFTNQQSIKEIDMDIKKESEIKLFKVTDIEDAIIENIQKKYFKKHPEKTFNIDEFKENISNLQGFSELIFAINIAEGLYSVCRIFKEFSRYTPFSFIKNDYIFILSAHLSNIILNVINKNPIKLAPIFGSINLLTLYKLHQLGFHPISLYSKDVVSNPPKIHDLRVGPLPTLLHDSIVHAYWGSLLDENHYKFVFEYLIPKSAELLQFDINDIQMMNYNLVGGNGDLFNLVDFDIENAVLHSERNSDTYLAVCMKFALGREKGDAFKVFVMLYQDRALIKEKYGVVFEEIINNPFFQDRLVVPIEKLLESLNSTVKDENLTP